MILSSTRHREENEEMGLLLGDEERENLRLEVESENDDMKKKNLVEEKIMEKERKNLDEEKSHKGTEMEEEKQRAREMKNLDKGKSKTHQGDGNERKMEDLDEDKSETGEGNLGKKEIAQEKVSSEEEEKEGFGDQSENEADNQIVIGGYNKERPPADDVCPICFDRFDIPVRGNCGHWFCANCFLLLWNFKSSSEPCKCPLCTCSIVNLVPEMSLLAQPPENFTAVMKKVQNYNSLHVGERDGLFHKLQAFRRITRRMFDLIVRDPDLLRCFYYLMRLIGIMLAFTYEIAEFNFFPSGGWGIRMVFDLGAGSLALILLFIVMISRYLQRRRIRRLAAEVNWQA